MLEIGPERRLKCIFPVRKRRLDLGRQLGSSLAREFVDARRYPRRQFEVNVRVYPRNSQVVRGHTVDISESGISALLREAVPVGEVVHLELTLPHGEVEVLAAVRQRSAFRYGFQFLESSEAQDVVGRTCRELSIGQVETKAKI